MSTGAIERRQYSDSEMVAWIVLAIVMLVFVPLALLISNDCYLNQQSYRVLKWALAASIVAASIACAVSVWRKGFVIRTKKGSRKLSPLECPFYVLMMGCVFGLYLWVATYAAMSFAVFVTASDLIQYQAQVFAIGGGKGCRNYYMIYNSPIERSIHFCGDSKLPRGTRSGETITVVEQIGPIGAHVNYVRPKL